MIAALSGMSTLEQVEQNTSAMQDFQPLDTKELSALAKVAAMMDGRMKYPLSGADEQKTSAPRESGRQS